MTEKLAPRVYAWVDMTDDLTGIVVHEEDWIGENSIPESLKDILREVGRGYVPVMLANAKALLAGDKVVEAVVGGKPWVQNPFPYQGKCLQWIREKYAALSEQHRKKIWELMEETGCISLLK